MKKHLNTLFVTTQGAYLAKEGETVAVKVDGEIVLRVPVHTLDGIVCFGQVSCSPYLMGFCAESGVAISFLTEKGRFLAKVQGPVSGNVLLRREQYRRADDLQSCSLIARAVVTGKIANCRTVLQRSLRDHSDKIEADEVSRASQCLVHSMRRSQKDDFTFDERNRRPPLDNVNCLLSFLYTLLMHDVRSALEAVGLDPAVGFLHRDRPGRYSLALDIMEEFRPFLADRLALSLINLCQVQGKCFKEKESGAVWMNDDARKTVLIAYQKRKQEEILHPFINEKLTIGLLPHVQAMLMARHLRGDLDCYPPFIWK
jgi:CRISPR-associated protein Cas1